MRKIKNYSNKTNWVNVFLSSDIKNKKRGVVTYINRVLKPKMIKTSKDRSFLLTEINKDDKKN